VLVLRRAYSSETFFNCPELKRSKKGLLFLIEFQKDSSILLKLSRYTTASPGMFFLVDHQGGLQFFKP